MVVVVVSSHSTFMQVHTNLEITAMIFIHAIKEWTLELQVV
jgi:hypothetical protein